MRINKVKTRRKIAKIRIRVLMVKVISNLVEISKATIIMIFRN